MSFWALLPAAASLAGTLLSRPKKKDYIYDTGYMDKYINSLRGQRLDSQISHMIMQPALRAIGQQGARFGRSVDYYTARRKPGGGVEAQMRLSGNVQALEAIEKAGEKAFSAQYRENRRIGDLIGRIEMEKGRYEAIGKREYSRARTQWGREVISGGLSLAAGISSSIAATSKANNDILEKAKSLDLVDDDMTVKEFKQMAANQGFKNTAMFTNQLARDRGIEQTLNVYDPSNIPPNEDIDAAVRAGEITAQYGRELKLKTHELQGEIEQFKTFNAADTDVITEDYVISQVEQGLDPKKGQELIDVIRAKEQKDEYIQNYASLVTGIESNRETMPENMAGRMNMIQKADLSYEQKMAMMKEEVTYSKKQLSSFRKSLYDEYFNLDSKPEKLLGMMDKKGISTTEADFIAGLYANKVKTLNEIKKGGIEVEKVSEGIAIGQIARNRLLLAQAKHRNKPAVKYVEELLNVKSYKDLANLGRNLAGIQTRIAEIAEYAEIPATLPGFSDLYGTEFSQADINVFAGFNSAERIKYLKQKWQDDVMDRVYKALKAAEFPGVGGFETELGLSPAWKGIPHAPDVFQNELQLTKYQESIPDDLSIWE